MFEAMDHIMEEASVALAKRDYLECEARCLEALQLSRRYKLWNYFSRILLPLQEARRHRRMIAAEGVVRLGFSNDHLEDEKKLEELSVGCVLLTPPVRVERALEIQRLARRNRKYVEVLYAQASQDGRSWILQSTSGPRVTCAVPAPQAEWADRWIEPGGKHAATPNGKTPGDWFVDATEALGDAALRSVDSAPGQEKRIEQLCACLSVVEDHEILHQKLAQAAMAMLESESASH